MRISVIIPLYNKKETIMRALESIMIQTLMPLEIIVVDDGSTDGSSKIIEQFQNPLVRLVSQRNSGVSEARNYGARLAKGDWLAFLDADDEWDKEYLITIKELHSFYPECNVLATSYAMSDQRGNRKNIELNKMPFCSLNGVLSNYFEVASNSHPPLWSSAITIKKDVLEKAGGFPKGVALGEDLLTWATLAVNSKIAYSKKNLSIYHLDGSYSYDNIPTREPEKPDIVGRNLQKLLMENGRIPGLKKYIGHWYIMRSSTFLRLGKSRNGFIEAAQSLRFNPLNYKAYIFMLLSFIPIDKNKIFKFLRS